MSSSVIVQQFVSGLKSKHHSVQNKAAHELLVYVKTELREMSQEEISVFFSDFNHHIFEMISSSDISEKKGGVLAINCLIGADIVNTATRISRYISNLRNLVTSNDVGVMEIAARTLVKLVCLPGTKGAESFDFDIKRAFEWLSAERHEYRRHAAVLILRELALAMPTYFYQSSKEFFSNIFYAIFDSKPAIRESACEALRAALIVVSDRESTKQSAKPQCYQTCYDKTMKVFQEQFTPNEKDKYLTRDDCISGGLMVLNELLRCSNAAWEKKYTQLKNLQPELRKHYHQPNDSHFTLVPKLIEKLGVSQTHFETDNSIQKFGSVNIQESESCRQILVSHYKEICEAVMEQRSSKSIYVQQAIALLLPRLAALQRETFVKEYLPSTISYLLRVPKRQERHSSHVTIGFVAVAVESDIERHIKPIMDSVKAGLPPKDLAGKKKSYVDPAVFICITLLSFAVKSKITEDIAEILDQMFATGLSPALTVCLRELSENVPQLKNAISKGVINMLPFILMDKVPIHYGAGSSPGYVMGQKQSIQFLGQENNVQHDIPTIVLALKTLGNFNFDDQNMLDFVQRCADFYINHDNQEVRLEAVQTCTTLLKAAIQQSDSENSKALRETVSHVLEKLLVVAVTDVDFHVRLRVLRCLDENFDPELAQPESLSALMITLHDEVFEIRELAIMTIGRLSAMNVAYIIPSLRKTLIQLLIELEHSGMSRNKEQSARMLDHLIVSTPRLISFYMQPILKILVSKLRESDSNPGVVLNVLRAIGDLAEVNGGSNEMEKWADELLKILLEMLSDLGNPDKRGVALWTLGQIVSATGRVVTPYHKYPNLIDILINFLKTETRKSIRLRTIRVLGLLGAMDPYKHKMNKGLIDYQDDNILISISDFKDEDTMDVSNAETQVDMHNFDEYYPAVALQTLIKILRDQTLSHLHTNVVQAITFTCQSLGIKCVRYLPQVLPNLLDNIRLAEMKDREFLIQQLSNLIEIVKQHIIGYMSEIFKLIREFWTPKSQLQSTFINLIEKIAVALGCEFRNYFSQLIPQILRVLTHDNSKDRHLTIKLLKALQMFGEILEDYLNLIIPPIVKLFDGPDVPQPVTVTALETIENLAYILNFQDFSSRIIHPLVRVLDHNSEIREQALSTLRALVVQLGKKYLVFVPLVYKVFSKHKIHDVNYEKLLTNVQEKTTMWLTEEFLTKQARYKQALENTKPGENSNPFKDLSLSEKDLKASFEITPRVSRDDWVEWLKRLSIGLLQQSPSPALRSCKALAQNHDKLLRDLFNAAFISCWQVLSDPQRNELTRSLIQALEVKDIPEITQTILNLAEFMEHCDIKCKLPISTPILGTRAMDCRAYAKALHYKEDEFKEKQEPQVFESLIMINTKLQQKEAAEGLLTSCQVANELKVQGQWYEKLHKYDIAVEHYREQLKEDSMDLNSRIGLMQCLGALGEWSELSDIARTEWPTLPLDGKLRAGRLAAVSSWGLQNWEEMAEYVRCIPEDTQDGSFYRAVIAVNEGEYEKAQRLIDETRDLLDTELTSMAGESYERAYGAMVCVQMLTELEEVIQYKLVPERRETIRKMWWNRLQGGQHSVEDWRRIIQVHSLVLTPHEDMHTWLKYASLCRKNNSLKLSQKTLVMLLGIDPSEHPNENLPINQPNVSYAYTKHMAKEGNINAAYDKLSRFVFNYSSQFKTSSDMDKEDKRILARCYMRLGRWKTLLCGITDPESIECILQSYEKATHLDEFWYKAWHHWAYTNFSILQDKKQRWTEANNRDLDFDKIISTYAVSAVDGFYHSIHLSKGNSLQDTLRLLTLWFDFGENKEVYSALLISIKKIEIHTWLQVIPQLIARIDTNRNLVRELVHELLMDIGKHHPQASVYPLTVATKSASFNRKQAADKILQSMRKQSKTLVDQAIMCSDELIRVAILWHEQWHEGLEEASRLYFGEGNAKGMFEILEPLHKMLENGPQTLKETSFAQAYGRELTEAREWCERYQNSGNKRDMDQAWDIYYHVFRKISKQLPQLTSLELPYVSPKLMECRDLELAVPGSYSPGKELIKISFIQKNLAVITSKQRPRKLYIRGSNGKDYIFLLKGHEDLRQDERVMQLFGLVNTLLQNDPETFRRNLTIQRYAVIPLSTNSGLIGWVPHCDTLHTLIKDYRDRDREKKIFLNMEHRLMLKKAPDYDHLTLMQKVEVFESALEQTRGDDLAKLLWLKSPSSEVWFERRTNYTRSLAVMSMVGYILGLGDRHPSNLMLDRMSGKILHIDFGDCFEVAMTREKFPEKIPFRLTRMLINAMEVTGIEGTYRKTCESVMGVLRHNKDSLMAVLEAFVYDPLLNWRLLDNADKSNRSKNNQGNDVISENGSDNDGMSLSIAHNNKQNINIHENFTNLEVTNKRAKIIVERVQHKLTGQDFAPTTVDVKEQVELLIKQATNNENLCQCYIGWCPFW